jgi:hypothetical protein
MEGAPGVIPAETADEAVVVVLAELHPLPRMDR